MFVETQSRSLLKTVVWRILATLITWTVVYYFTGKFFESGKIIITAAALSMVAYYFFERIWNRVQWGRKDKP